MDKAIKAARLAGQIRDYIALWSRQDLPGLLFTVSDTTLTPDFREATLWIEVMRPEEAPRILQLLGSHRSRYQQRLNRLSRTFSLIKISFRLDESAALQETLDKLLNS